LAGKLKAWSNKYNTKQLQLQGCYHKKLAEHVQPTRQTLHK